MEDRTGTYEGSYPFTPAELERLYIFRQAVLAGFYTDEIDERVGVRSATSESVQTRDETQSPSQN
jgi:hypothetical protein